jgi:hypothetical protein
MRAQTRSGVIKIRTASVSGLLVALALAIPCGLWPAPIHAAQKASDVYTIPTPPPADYSRLQWLIGDWSGTTVGKGMRGKVVLSTSYALKRRFMVLREQVSLLASKAAPATEESFVGILSGTASPLKYELVLYSSNGFVSLYEVSADSEKIVFNPEGGLAPPPGWLFRRVIRRTDRDQCVETVDVAPPGQTFFNYYTVDLRHTKPGAGSGSAVPKEAKTRRFLFWHRKD